MSKKSLKSKSSYELIQEIYLIVDELESRFEGRRFTPDGHLVGSLGEVIAEERYELDLLRSSTPTHDARSRSGRRVQIKLTQRRSVALRNEPDYLIVLSLDRAAEVSEIYNGPGSDVWQQAGPLQKNGQRSIGLRKLEALDKLVGKDQRIPRRSPS